MSESFQGLPEALQRALTDKGFTQLTQVQKAVSETDSLSTDLRISSQTGSGKTVAVGIAIARELIAEGERSREKGARIPTALVLTPTRELASQVQRELVWLLRHVPDASVEVVTGGTSVFGEKKVLAMGPRVLVGTPGRVLDHLNSGAFVGDAVRLVVLDEADQMLDMGFRDELTGILDLIPNRNRTHLLSATFSGEVLAVAKRYQTSPLHIEGSPLGSANADIEHLAHVVPNNHRYDALVNILLLAHARRGDDTSGRSLIFTRTRADTIEVAERLQRDGVRAEPLSGDLAQAQRTRTLAAFRSGRVTTLVATDVAARGLDVQGVDLVIHFEPPGDSDTFTHRSGRTGRAGQKGTSILLLPPQARRRVERLLQDARIKPNWAQVPTADKIEKAYSKWGRRRIHQAIEVEPTEDQLAYAKKLFEEHPPERVVAAMIALLDFKPPSPPREISTGFPVERHAHPRDRASGPGYQDRYGGGEGRFARKGGAGPRPHGHGAPRDAGPREDRGPGWKKGPRDGGFDSGARVSGAAPRFPRPEGGGERSQTQEGGAPGRFRPQGPGGSDRGPSDKDRAPNRFQPRPFKKVARPRPAGPRGK